MTPGGPIEPERRFSKVVRVAWQGAVITGSILLALALESWWGELADGRAEVATLASLESELAGNRDEMLRARAVHETRCAAIASLREAIGGRLPGVDARVIGELTRDGASVTSVDAPLGVLRGLISSGRLDLIADDALRASLAGWPARLDDHREAELYIHAVVRDQWVPWLVANSVLTEDWGRGEAGPPSATAARTLTGILENQEFQNLVMMQDYYCTFVLRETVLLEADIEGLRRMVADER